MRLISWNISWQSAATSADRISALAERKPDLVALQEVRDANGPAFDEQLRRLDLIVPSEKLKWKGGHGLLLASKWPIERLKGTTFTIPTDEAGLFRKPAQSGPVDIRMLSALVRHPTKPFEVHVVHIPPGSGAGWRKIDAFRAVRKRLARASDVPRILCGDFNEPRSETATDLTSWAKHNKHAKSDPKKWAAAVESVLRGLADFDLVDVFRKLHPTRVEKLRSVRIKGVERRRYDHVLASESLGAKRAAYLDVDEKLSDHKPAFVEFEMRS